MADIGGEIQAENQVPVQSGSSPAFKVGDVVRLKSGGFPMTVEFVEVNGDVTRGIEFGNCICLWHDANGVPQSYDYPEAVLVATTTDAIGHAVNDPPFDQMIEAIRARNTDDWRGKRGLT